MQGGGRWRVPPAACKSKESRLGLDRFVLFVEKRHAVAREKPVDGAMIFRDEAIEFAFPVLVGVSHAHADAVGNAWTALLMHERDDVEIGLGVLDEVAADRTPENRDIDFAGLQVLEHLVRGRIKTRVDDEWIGVDRL